MTLVSDRTAQLRHHAALLDDTASRLGMDLQEAAIRGALRFDEISEAVLRCTTCSEPEACAKWLKADDAVVAAPHYCRNTQLLKRLQGTQ
jgi:hypothetical protein